MSDNPACDAASGYPVGTDNGDAFSCNASTFDKLVCGSDQIVKNRLGHDLRSISSIASVKNYYIEDFGGGTDKTGAENALALKTAIETIGNYFLTIGKSGDLYLFDAVSLTSESCNISVMDGVTIESTMNSAAPLWLFYSQSSSVIGNFTIDCKDSNCVGIRVRNTQGYGVDGKDSNYHANYTVKNVKQQSALTTDQANGVTFWGAFRYSEAVNVKVVSVKSDGPATRLNGATARGIVFRYDSNTLLTSRIALAERCYVEGLSPASEADGVFAQENPFFYGQDSTLIVKNCVFKNCLKRSVKSQYSKSDVSGNVTIKTLPSDLTDDSGAFGIDYDMQYSNADCYNNTAFYYGADTAPQSMLVLSAHQTLEYNGAVSTDDQPSMSGNFFGNKAKLIGGGTPKDDFTGRKFRLLTIQNRTNNAGGFVDFTSIDVTNNECDVPSDMLVWCFLMNRETATQIKALNVNNNYIRSTSKAIVVTSDGGGIGSSRCNINVSGISTSGDAINQVHLQDVGNDKNSVNYAPKQNDTILGSNFSNFSGTAKNTDTVAVQLYVPRNTQFTIECEYSRPSNGKNQVRSYVQIVGHQSALGGIRGQVRNNEVFDRQAGQWELVGNTGTVWSQNANYTIINVVKSAGTTTDSYGNVDGAYSLRVNCAKPCLLAASNESVGSNSASYNMDILIESSTFTALTGATHAVNSSAVNSCNTPTNPSDGDEFTIFDYRNFFDQFDFNVTYSSHTIDGKAEDYQILGEGAKQTFRFQGATNNWQPVSAKSSGIVEDSAKLGGVEASRYARLDAGGDYQEGHYRRFFTDPTKSIKTGNFGAHGSLEVFSTGGTDSFMSFHKNGVFAFNFGFSAELGKLAVGGWSMGNNAYAIYHEGNPPPAPTIPTATTDAAGVVEKATSAEALAGTADKYPDAADVLAVVNANYPPAASINFAGIVEKATTIEALTGTANKYPDAQGVLATVAQYGIGDTPVQVSNFSSVSVGSGFFAFYASNASGGPAADFANVNFVTGMKFESPSNGYQSFLVSELNSGRLFTKSSGSNANMSGRVWSEIYTNESFPKATVNQIKGGVSDVYVDAAGYMEVLEVRAYTPNNLKVLTYNGASARNIGDSIPGSELAPAQTGNWYNFNQVTINNGDKGLFAKVI